MLSLQYESSRDFFIGIGYVYRTRGQAGFCSWSWEQHMCCNTCLLIVFTVILWYELTFTIEPSKACALAASDAGVLWLGSA